jgi:hypothetical protein
LARLPKFAVLRVFNVYAQVVGCSLTLTQNFESWFAAGVQRAPQPVTPVSGRSNCLVMVSASREES